MNGGLFYSCCFKEGGGMKHVEIVGGLPLVSAHKGIKKSGEGLLNKRGGANSKQTLPDLSSTSFHDLLLKFQTSL